MSTLDEAISDFSQQQQAPAGSSNLEQAIHEIHADAGEPSPVANPSLWDRYLGWQEGQLHGFTGGIGGLVGGLGYLGSLAETGDSDKSLDVMRRIQKGMTYEPRTASGKQQAADMDDAASYMGERGGEIAGDATFKATGSPALAAGVKTAYNVPQFLLGAKAGGEMTPELPTPETPLTPQLETLQKGQALGLKVPPSTTNPSLPVTTAEALAGKVSTAQHASALNQPIFNSLAKRELGLPEDADLTEETLQNLRDQQGQHYAAVAAIPEIKFGDSYNKELAQITAKSDKINSALPDFKATGSQQISNLVKSLKPANGVMDGETAVELSKTLRKEATDYNMSASRSGSPQDRALGKAYSQAAAAVENAVKDHLEQTGQPELAQNWDNARRTIAKSYSVQQALDGAGNVDAAKLGKQSIKGKPLSGNLETMADFANAFPKASKVGASKESILGSSPLDYYTALGAGVATHLSGHGGLPTDAAVAAAVPVGRHLARKTLLSGIGQKLANPKQPGPSVVPGFVGRSAVTGLPATSDDR